MSALWWTSLAVQAFVFRRQQFRHPGCGLNSPSPRSLAAGGLFVPPVSLLSAVRGTEKCPSNVPERSKEVGSTTAAPHPGLSEMSRSHGLVYIRHGMSQHCADEGVGAKRAPRNGSCSLGLASCTQRRSQSPRDNVWNRAQVMLRCSWNRSCHRPP